MNVGGFQKGKGYNASDLGIVWIPLLKYDVFKHVLSVLHVYILNGKNEKRMNKYEVHFRYIHTCICACFLVPMVK